MNELNKLIEKYADQYNLPVAAKVSLLKILEGCDPMVNDFINFILESRPTCGVEQRKFLDEIEEEGRYDHKARVIEISSFSELDQDDFDCDLSKVIKGE